MLPLINGKNFLDCTEEDLQVLIDNPDYKENEYIDYKFNFAFLELNKGKEREAKKAEFRSDVCSFANSEGGYLIIGISEEGGCVSSIEGIDIENEDHFELDIRNVLNAIQPKLPPIKFKFVKLSSGKHVVILFVGHDNFAPYIHIVDERNYNLYKRNGNGKRIMSYMEMRQMFNQSLLINDSIDKYRKQRILYYKNLKNFDNCGFAYVSFIPETFIDFNFRQNMFVFEKSGVINFKKIFSGLGCDYSPVPCVDGLRYLPYDEKYGSVEGNVNNNGIIEACIYLNDLKKEKYPNGYLPWKELWSKIDLFCFEYNKIFDALYNNRRVFVCLSLIGLKNVSVSNECNEYRINTIDRDEIICEPIEIINDEDENGVRTYSKHLYLEYVLSIGIRQDDVMKKYIKDLYENVKVEGYSK